MSEIKVLDQKIANKIAAGEVVERPYNVVKELVENSLDAGADFIRVDIYDGGIGLVRVTDNGKGILPEDLKNSVLRYSTSKIESIEDVYRINTFGFRGEALAAISSVSDFKIESKREGFEAYELTVEWGKIGELKPGCCQQGTIVTVKNLFENVPARRKFIKSFSAEQREIVKFLKVFSIINYNVDIEFYSDDKKILSFTKYDSMKDRFIECFGLKDVSYLVDKKDNIELECILTLPGVQRNRKDMIFVGLNNRVIKDFSVMQALIQGYYRKLPQNKYPAAVLSLKVKPEMVDVNVHPTKMNVKFFDDREIFSTVSRAVSNHLGSLKLNESKENYSYDISDDSIKYVVEEKRTVYSVNIDNLFETEEIQNESVNEFKIIGQIFDSVILVEIDSEVYFIDQHIAHERVLYEKFISEAEKTSIKIKLVEPVVIEVLEEDKEIIIKNIKNFEKIGFDLEDFGGNFVSVLSVPTSIVHKNIENEFMELINEFHKNKNENLLDSLSITMACKTAIKAGEKLTDYEMKKVVSELFQTKNPFTCPHGRPIIYKMSKEEIFKKFHRL